jgi:predicted O-methyltransferase YrrM
MESALSRVPNVIELSKNLGLDKYIYPDFRDRSYVWALTELVHIGERFDFVYIDGAHSLEVDGFAFFLVDQILRPGGTIIFDDIDWSYATSPSLKNSPEIRKLPVDMQDTPQMRVVFERLVATHPRYTSTFISKGWGWARKNGGSPFQKPLSNWKK